MKKLFSPERGITDGIWEMLEMIDLGGHLYGLCALRVPESAGRFVDIAGYIRAGLSHVAPVQARCVLLHPQWLRARSWWTAWLAGDNCSKSSPARDIEKKSHYLFLLLYLIVKPSMSLFMSNIWERRLRTFEGKFLRLPSEQRFSGSVLVSAESEESDPLGPRGAQHFQPECQLKEHCNELGLAASRIKHPTSVTK